MPTTPALPPFELVPPGKLRERLNASVLRGRKTATSRLVVMDEMAGIAPEPAGTRLSLLDSEGRGVAEIEIVETRVLPFAEVGEDVSSQEGEWIAELADWRVAHRRYWTGVAPEIREYLGDPAWELTDASPVIVRFFRLVSPS